MEVWWIHILKRLFEDRYKGVYGHFEDLSVTVDEAKLWVWQYSADPGFSTKSYLKSNIDLSWWEGIIFCEGRLSGQVITQISTFSITFCGVCFKQGPILHHASRVWRRAQCVRHAKSKGLGLWQLQNNFILL